MLDKSVNFKSLIAPITAEQFFEEYFGEKPLHIPGDEDKFSRIFSWEGLNQLMNMTSIWSSHNMGLTLDTEPISDERYCLKGMSRENEEIMEPDFHKIAAFMEQGATIKLNRVETLHEGIAAVSRALQMNFSSFVQCNLYSSWKQRKAFSSHFDAHDVFALHITGEKIWRIYENRFDRPVEEEGYNIVGMTQELIEKDKGELLQEVTMKPGNLLYLPKGVYHDALATTDACLHLTFGIMEVRGFQVLRDIFGSLLHDPLFRECIPQLEDRDQLADYLARMGNQLCEILSLPETIEQVRNFQKSQAFKNLPGFSMPSPLFDQTFRVTTRPNKVVREGKIWFLNYGGQKVELEGNHVKMVQWILDGDYFDIDSLVEKFRDEETPIKVIDVLVNIGLIEPVK